MTRYPFRFELAVLVSLVLHILVLGGWQHRQALARLPVLRALVRQNPPTAVPPRVSEPPVTPTLTFLPPREPERPQQFVETDASQVTGEKPVRAEYYSDNATVAANPSNPNRLADETPYLDGKQTRVPSTVTALPGSGSGKVVAPPTPPVPVAPTVAEGQPKAVAEAGLKVVEEKKVAMAAGPPPRAAMPAAPPMPPSLPGSGREIAAEKSQATTSGAAKIGVTAFNVAESPFGAYDKAIVRAVQSRWFALIEKNGLYERSGQVTLHFQLLDDGTVQAVEVKENSAGQILALFCEKAIVESAPFSPLPEELRMLVGREPREVNFTFYY